MLQPGSNTVMPYQISHGLVTLPYHVTVLPCAMALAQTKNALERLAGTFVEGHSVDQSFGGEATTQDLVRLVLCAHIACDRDVKRSNDIVSEADSQALMPSFLTAISAVLPDIVSVLKAEPDATALERAGTPACTSAA